MLLDLLDALAELVVVGRLQVTQVQRLDDVPRGVADADASRLGCIGGTVHAGLGVTTEVQECRGRNGNHRDNADGTAQESQQPATDRRHCSHAASQEAGCRSGGRRGDIRVVRGDRQGLLRRSGGRDCGGPTLIGGGDGGRRRQRRGCERRLCGLDLPDNGRFGQP